MENKDIAKAVIEAIGGRDNVSSVAHCATRLRVMVKDEAKIDKDRVENLEKVQGAFFNSGQYQIIFGTGTVNKIYDEVVALGLPTSSTGEQKAEAAKKGNWFQRAVRTFGDVFVPIIPVIVATGLFMGIRGAINNDTILGLFGTTSKAFAASDFYTYTVVLTDTAFAFFLLSLPILLIDKNFFNGPAEIPGDLEGQQDRGIVSPVLQRPDGLPGDGQRRSQLLLADATFFSEFFQTIFQGGPPFLEWKVSFPFLE